MIQHTHRFPVNTDHLKNMIETKAGQPKLAMSLSSKEQTHRKVLQAIQTHQHSPIQPSAEQSISAALAQNSKRLKKYSSNPNVSQRLTTRQNNLNYIQRLFKARPDLTFIGLIGWGDGCLPSDLNAKQNISAVDGVLFKDSSDRFHYLRLSSCLEYFSEHPQVVENPQDSNSIETHTHDLSQKSQEAHSSHASLPIINPKSEHKKLNSFRRRVTKKHHHEGQSCGHSHLNHSNHHLDENACHHSHHNESKSEQIPSMNLTSDHFQSFEDISSCSDLSKPTQLHISKLNHGDHDHETLSKVDPSKVLFQNPIQSDSEGCPCCTAGLDFDEFAAAIKMMDSIGNSSAELHHLAHIDDGAHWGIYFGLALPFSVVGLTLTSKSEL